jgi:hypothetical protein
MSEAVDPILPCPCVPENLFDLTDNNPPEFIFTWLARIYLPQGIDFYVYADKDRHMEVRINECVTREEKKLAARKLWDLAPPVNSDSQ